MSGDDLNAEWLTQLYELREQGMHVTDINPISALADIIGEQIASGDLSSERLGLFLDHYAVELWQQRVENLRTQTGLDERQHTQTASNNLIYDSGSLHKKKHMIIFVL